MMTNTVGISSRMWISGLVLLMMNKSRHHTMARRSCLSYDYPYFQHLFLIAQCIFLIMNVQFVSAGDGVDEKFVRELSSLYTACSPCDPDVLALKLSAYLRFINSKRSAFLEDERNKFAEEAPWYLGKRSLSSAGPSSLIDYPTSYGWRVGKRLLNLNWDADDTDDDVVTAPRVAVSNAFRRAGVGPAALWLMQPRAQRDNAEKWRVLMHQPW